LALTAAVTVPTLSAQTTQDWEWVVLMHGADPLWNERWEVLRGVPVAVTVLLTDEPTSNRARAAARAYKAPWDNAVESSSGDLVLTTRLDDDDGLAPGYLADVRSHSRSVRSTMAFVYPRGYRVWNQKYVPVRHDANAMQTLATTEPMTVYSYGHTRVRDHVPVTDVEGSRWWLWVRHLDTLTPRHRRATRLFDATLRKTFPGVDWSQL
jgi:hypothetical protein